MRWSLSNEGTHFIRRFGVEGRHFSFSIPSSEVLTDVINEILNETLSGVDDTTLVGMELGHENLSHSVFVPFRPRRDVEGSHLMDNVQRVTQSKNVMDGSGEFNLRLVLVER